MPTFMRTSSRSHLAKSLNEYPRSECKPDVKVKSRPSGTVDRFASYSGGPRNIACHRIVSYRSSLPTLWSALRPYLPGLIIVQKYNVQNLDVDVINRKLLIYFSLFQSFS